MSCLQYGSMPERDVLISNHTDYFHSEDAEAVIYRFIAEKAQLVGFQKSVSEIYAYLFVQSVPVSMDQISDELGRSIGSVSQGLKALRRLKAVKNVYLSGERKDFYAIESDIRKLLNRILDDEIIPEFKEFSASLDRIQDIVENGKEETPLLLKQRLKMMRRLGRKTNRLLPFLSRFLKVID